MKRCPQCQRTYADDSTTFCLADGSLLSAPYDSGVAGPTLNVRLEPAPTEIMKQREPSHAKPNDGAAHDETLSPTIPATPFVVNGAHVGWSSRPAARQTDSFWVTIAGVVTVVVVIVVGIAVFIGYRISGSDEKSGTLASPEVTDSNETVSPKPAPTIGSYAETNSDPQPAARQTSPAEQRAIDWRVLRREKTLRC